MASLLRQIVASPRSRHPEAGLDLCYVTDEIIATSGPSATYPSRAYRNPLPALLRFLDGKHGPDNWAIWEFRAEGTGYPDAAVGHRIWHFPWPDHHPPPFALVPGIVGSMRNWIRDGVRAPGELVERERRGEKGDERRGEEGKRVIVVHCKAGKGRSGTASCAYLVSECGWSLEDALRRFTERRMRPGFGAGVSIPSQLRYLRYVDRWVRTGKVYVERRVAVTEIQCWGVRDGVKISVEGFADNGRRIQTVWRAAEEDMEVVGGRLGKSGLADVVAQVMGREKEAKGKGKTRRRHRLRACVVRRRSSSSSSSSLSSSSSPRADRSLTAPATTSNPNASASGGGSSGVADDSGDPEGATDSATGSPKAPDSGYATPTRYPSTPPDESSPAFPPSSSSAADSEPRASTADIIYRPRQPCILETNDINIDVERRNKAAYGLTMVTAVAHVWFNTFFEGGSGDGGSSDAASPPPSLGASEGTFDIAWEAMDGIKGSSRKGTKAFDRMRVRWTVVAQGPAVREPPPEEQQPTIGRDAADWRQTPAELAQAGALGEKDLGLRRASPPALPPRPGAAVGQAGQMVVGGGAAEGDGGDERVRERVRRQSLAEVEAELVGVRSDVSGAVVEGGEEDVVVEEGVVEGLGDEIRRSGV